MKTGIITILPALVALSSCTLIVDCIEGNGSIRTEEREAVTFNAIANETSFHVIYIQGNEYSITVEAESNILPFIETEISGGALEVNTVKGTHCLRYLTQPVITVTAPFISELVNAGSGDIVAGNLEGEEVKIVASGSGDIFTGTIGAEDVSVVVSGSGNIMTGETGTSTFRATLSGSGDLTISGEAVSSRYVVSGSGSVFSVDLSMESAVVTMSGSGSVYATVYDQLDAVISGSGNIYLRGDPEVSLTRTGSGRIINL
jgi:Putative auto-transporter adhesin, head GIN domain